MRARHRLAVAVKHDDRELRTVDVVNEQRCVRIFDIAQPTSEQMGTPRELGRYHRKVDLAFEPIADRVSIRAGNFDWQRTIVPSDRLIDDRRRLDWLQ